MQRKFRAALIEAYDGRYTGPEDWDCLLCPIMGFWTENGIAGHLFAYMHGQETMDAIFGRTGEPELFSPRNGLILSAAVEKVFDIGFLVVVPQLSERPTKIQIAEWLTKTPREYMTRIIDTSSPRMDQRTSPTSDLKYRDLDNRPLTFRNNFRPAARYLYFHYCLKILRRAWKQPVEQGRLTLNNEIGKNYWGTPGRYLPRNMLLAFVEELGHEHDEILRGASCSKGEDLTLLAVASKQVKRRPPLNLGTESESDSDEEEEEEEEEE